MLQPILRIVALMLALFPLSLMAAEGTIADAMQASIDKKQPIHVYADKLTVKTNKNKAHFEKNVKVVQGEATLTSDSMMIYYDEQAENQISQIEINQGVKLVLPDRSVQADEGFYDTKEGKMELNGNVVMQRGKSIIKGTQFLYDSTTKKSLLKGHKITNINRLKPSPVEELPPVVEVVQLPEEQGVVGPMPQMVPLDKKESEKEKFSFNPLKAIGRLFGSIFEKEKE